MAGQFINTDVQYNDNGDVNYYMRNDRFRNSLVKYRFTPLTAKEKYLQLRRSHQEANAEEQVLPSTKWNDEPLPQ